MPSLSDRLTNLGFKKANEIASPLPKKTTSSLVDVLDGRKIENQFGSVILVEKTYPYGYWHGNVEFIRDVDIDSIHKVGKMDVKTSGLHNLIFLDTETTGLSGGTGTLAFLIGIARFTEKGLELAQFIIEDPTDENAMLLEFSNSVTDVDAVVTFNGKSFDLPLLRSRFVLNRMPRPFDLWGHLDLLHLSRRIWRQRLPSRTLKDLEQEILRMPRSEEEVPGWIIPEIYFDFLRSSDPSQLVNVVYHNAMDIVSLAALYLSISNMLEKDLFSGQFHILDVFAIGQLYENIGEQKTARTIYEYCLSDKDFTREELIEVRSRLAMVYKRDSNWEKALPLWEANGESGDFGACVESAKYYEHIACDAKSALFWTNSAEKNLEKMLISRYKKKELVNDLIKRKKRLEKRINHV